MDLEEEIAADQAFYAKFGWLPAFGDRPHAAGDDLSDGWHLHDIHMGQFKWRIQGPLQTDDLELYEGFTGFPTYIGLNEYGFRIEAMD